MKDPEKNHADSASRSRESYIKDPEKSAADSTKQSRESYKTDPEKSRAESYMKDPEKSCVDSASQSQESYMKVGELLKAVRSISQQTFSEEAFEEGSHTLSSEPYFRDTSYKSPALKEVTVIDHENKCLATELRSINENEYSLDEISIAVDRDGRCHLNVDDEKGSNDNEDRQIIIDLKNEFNDDSIESVRDVLQTVDDGCDHGHYCKFSNCLVDIEEEISTWPQST